MRQAIHRQTHRNPPKPTHTRDQTELQDGGFQSVPAFLKILVGIFRNHKIVIIAVLVSDRYTTTGIYC